jgi:hypothetical protein
MGEGVNIFRSFEVIGELIDDAEDDRFFSVFEAVEDFDDSLEDEHLARFIWTIPRYYKKPHLYRRVGFLQWGIRGNVSHWYIVRSEIHRHLRHYHRNCLLDLANEY